MKKLWCVLVGFGLLFSPLNVMADKFEDYLKIEEVMEKELKQHKENFGRVGEASKKEFKKNFFKMRHEDNQGNMLINSIVLINAGIQELHALENRFKENIFKEFLSNKLEKNPIPDSLMKNGKIVNSWGGDIVVKIDEIDEILPTYQIATEKVPSRQCVRTAISLARKSIKIFINDVKVIENGESVKFPLLDNVIKLCRKTEDENILRFHFSIF